MRTFFILTHFVFLKVHGRTGWMYQAILPSAVPYTLLCKLNYGYHN